MLGRNFFVSDTVTGKGQGTTEKLYGLNHPTTRLAASAIMLAPSAIAALEPLLRA